MEILTEVRDRAARAAPSTTAPIRFVTATSLFDGHDAAINIMRRLIQAHGAEVVHLGHNRSVEDIVRAAVQEDADAIAVTSYQGGHLEFFRFMIDMLRERDAAHIRVFAGGGGTITQEEAATLESYGVERIYRPDDGLRMGLVGMIDDVMRRAGAAATRRRSRPADSLGEVVPGTPAGDVALGRLLSAIESGRHPGDSADDRARHVPARPDAVTVPVIGVTGTGGAGKSSVVDELLLRFLQAFPEIHIAVLAVDPTRRRSGGALLGDRIRMNALRSERVFMRSMATRRQNASTSATLRACVERLKQSGFDLVIVETAGIGQSDSEIVDLVDLPVYVMTSDYGAASQLEKVDMIDFADVLVLNKYDRRGGEDALRDVRKQWKRNRTAFSMKDEDVPVYPTVASQFNDPGITRLFVNLCRILREKLALPVERWPPAIATPGRVTADASGLIPASRVRYLAEIAEHGRHVTADIERRVEAATKVEALRLALSELRDPQLPERFGRYAPGDLDDAAASPMVALRRSYQSAIDALGPEAVDLLKAWPQRHQAITATEFSYDVRGRSVTGTNYVESLSHQQIPKIAAPTYRTAADLLRFLLSENLPGAYPYTAGVFPYRRAGEDPIRMFAGEGTPERTNRRFHYLSRGQSAVRLSTAFDSVTLYGEDPHRRPDIYGKVGNSGVSIGSLDDMKKLYSGFDLASPATSVSMTINGPAPMILAMFMNTAIDQAVETYLREDPARWLEAEAQIAALYPDGTQPRYDGPLPPGNNGLGLALLGVSGDQLVPPDVYARLRARTLKAVRGTVQADILKEDQAQNTCIFSTEFALRVMGDVQQFFIDHQVRNFYSVSISGYHIAEAGANPISQLAFTLANGFTIVEYYLARGMTIDEFAPNLSFFLSNGMDPEYSVIGRVARRIWARAMRERYHAAPRSQMLKYHVQTSGRSLHAQEIQFNDIRTTLQAAYALFDNCNSLHTNAYDEAVTTPTEESVRRAVAIQLIINRELGLNICENPWQGSFIIEQLTTLVEEAVYREFDALSARGGVLGAMDTMYQRSKIQDESLHYEAKKHDGSLPLIGVNTFMPEPGTVQSAPVLELIRSTEAERSAQVAGVEHFRRDRNRAQAPDAGTDGRVGSLDDLQRAAKAHQNVFERLMEATKYYSLGQITHALYAVGGEYRRSM